jgi:hypothetical protein
LQQTESRCQEQQELQDNSLAAEASTKAAEPSKENAAAVLCLRKQKQFIAPASGMHTVAGLGLIANCRQEAAGQCSTFEEVIRVFAVLYTKREKAMVGECSNCVLLAHCDQHASFELPAASCT